MPGQAGARPSWQFVLICPIVKIRADSLPQRPNLHYLGPKPYGELPAYLAGWDATFMPFALNEATRFISPTKTPEYLAAGRPVVSTPVRDVVREWGERGLVRIAATPEEAVAALEGALGTGAAHSAWLRAVDRALAATSWDETFARMRALIP
jgi:glycosyltransferase involved in cell wall biosynthesis